MEGDNDHQEDNNDHDSCGWGERQREDDSILWWWIPTNLQKNPYILGWFVVVVTLVTSWVVLMLMGSSHVVIATRQRQRRQTAQKEEEEATRRAVPGSKSQVVVEDAGAQTLKAAFLQRAGSDYGYGDTVLGHIDEWRPRELPALVRPVGSREPGCGDNDDDEPEVYLDFAGAALPHVQQLRDIVTLHSTSILANPHSGSGPAAARTFRAMEEVQKRLLDLWQGHAGRHASVFGSRPGAADDEDDDDEARHPGYELIFTSGTTQALERVAHAFPWQSGRSTLVYPLHSHTSVIGMRGPALARGANFQCWHMDELVQAIHAHQFVATVVQSKTQTATSTLGPDSQEKTVHNLLVLPAECNFTGDRVDVETLIRKLKRQQHDGDNNQHQHQWWTLVDLAKVACTSPLHLRKLNPDLACLSFYKIFGEPTGLGCLLVKKGTALQQLLAHHNNHYFGGGSVDLVLARQDVVVPRGSSTSEDSLAAATTMASLGTHGTPHFRGIVALKAGLDLVERLGGMATIQRHTSALLAELLRRLDMLVHANGVAAIEIYKSRQSGVARGPTVALNVVRSDGSYVGYNEVSKLAALNRPPIQLRTGCFCNPGACQSALHLSDEEVLDNYHKSGHVCGDDVDVINGKPTGAVRLSLGKDSTWEDVDSVVNFLQKAFVNHTALGPSSLSTAGILWDAQPCQVVVTELYVYPIKSCRAQQVVKWPLDAGTLRPMWDREFALVDSLGHAMRLQRYPRMALIAPQVNLETRTMTVSAPNMEPLTLFLERDDDQTHTNNGGVVRVCGNRCGGLLLGDSRVSQWFSDFLGVQCWFARHSSTKGQRDAYDLPKDTLPTTLTRSASVAFANEQPLLLISEHAVELLNSILQQSGQRKVSSRHFRPNIVVRFAGGYRPASTSHAEDGWTRLRWLNKSGPKEVAFAVVGQCARCSMVDVDPSSGTKGHALRALADYRRRTNGQITFGIFLKGQEEADELSTTPRTAGAGSSWLKEGDVLCCE